MFFGMSETQGTYRARCKLKMLLILSPNPTRNRYGTGKDFLDRTGKFQNLRRLTARLPVSDLHNRPVFLHKAFVKVQYI